MFVAESLDKVPAWQVGAKQAIPGLKSEHGRLTDNQKCRSNRLDGNRSTGDVHGRPEWTRTIDLFRVNSLNGMYRREKE